jgi:integrase
MGLYKLCDHRDRARDRCEHAWWARFRHVRVSLNKWADRDIRTKTEADAVYDDLRKAVRAGTFDPRGVNPPKEQTALTFREFAKTYKERHAVAKALALAKTIDYRLKPLLEAFGDRPLAEIRTADVEDFIADLKKPRTVNRLPNRRLTPASINRSLQLLRHMFNWAVGREYLEKTPFRRGTVTLIRKEREDNKRRRRISPEEEERLLSLSPPHLRSMIIAALDTGMRRGEMLALRFADIDLTRRLIVLRGTTTKSKKTRVVPISTQRLEAVLRWLRLDAASEEKPAETPVFSDETGEPMRNFRKTFVLTVLRAHGVTPHWRKQGGWKHLTRECQQQFQKIDLHWHDLRHEYASRLVERHVPLAQVRDLLGHASIITTERYDNQTLENLQQAAGRLEEGKTFDTEPRNATGHDTTPRDTAKREKTAGSQARSHVLSSFSQDPAATPTKSPADHQPATDANCFEDRDLESWYRYGDINPCVTRIWA